MIVFALLRIRFSLTGRSVNDNDDLAHRAKVLLNRMCGVLPPRSLINPILDAMFDAIQTSPVRIPFENHPLIDTYACYSISVVAGPFEDSAASTR